MKSGELCFTAFFFVLFFVAAPVRAEDATKRVLVVVPEAGAELHSESTNQVVEKLKEARDKLKVASGTLPILRLDPGKDNHALVLARLELEQGKRAIIAVCDQNSDGWPTRVVYRFSSLDRARIVITSGLGDRGKKVALREREQSVVSVPSSRPHPTIGLLLISHAEEAKQKSLRSEFLGELGRHWVRRYGRVRPSPYPLASYNVGDTLVAERVFQAFSELNGKELPLICLALFQDGKPVQLLQVYDDLQLPGTLVRRVSADRRRYLADTLEVGKSSVAAPTAEPVSLSASQERTLLLGRLKECAQQLWSGLDDGPNGENRLARRLLLTMVQEIDETDLSGDMSPGLVDALEDIQEEAVVLKRDSEYRDLYQRLTVLVKSLLDQRSE